MIQKKLILGALALMTTPVFAQRINFYDTGRKWSTEFDALIEGKDVQRLSGSSLKSITPENIVSAIVTARDAAAVGAYVEQQGFEFDVITDDVLTVKIPASFIRTLSEHKDVLFINGSRQFRPLMHHVRRETGIEKVQTGSGLDTPFTGKGVVVGVIDQGFQYDHMAFDNRNVMYGSRSTSGTLTSKRPSRDLLDNSGHATHVTNIAAGGKVSGVDDYGIAYESDLVLVSSDFGDNSVLSQAKSIKKHAENQGKPWVINMSFGGILGPHDGSTDYDQTMSKLCGEGGVMVAAMGNEGGDRFHVQGVIEDADKPLYFYMKPDNTYNPDKFVLSDVWAADTLGKEELEITPVVYSARKIYRPTKAQLSSLGYGKGISSFNNRQTAYLRGSVLNFAQALGTPANSSYLLWEIKGPKGKKVHAWIDGTVYRASFEGLRGSGFVAMAGDDEYMVCEGAASIPRAISVASYNAAKSFVSHNGNTVTYQVGEVGGISNFSSKGPHLSADKKPCVAAPGGVIHSALSNYSSKPTDREITQIIKRGGKSHYYGVKSGTSMATPVITGVVALWLEANPSLTPEQVKDIIKATSRRDDSTGKADENNWNLSAGYGKIDAYEGLKKALELAKNTGINETLNTEKPVTFSKQNDSWKVLFNNDESFAVIRLYSLEGKLIQQNHVNSPRRGDEQCISLSNLKSGVYLLRVNTTASSITRKVVVK